MNDTAPPEEDVTVRFTSRLTWSNFGIVIHPGTIVTGEIVGAYRNQDLLRFSYRDLALTAYGWSFERLSPLEQLALVMERAND